MLEFADAITATPARVTPELRQRLEKRFSTPQLLESFKAAIPLAILSGVLGASVGGWAGSLAQMGISIGAGSVFTKYSRDA